jgi:hypothetical protein
MIIKLPATTGPGTAAQAVMLRQLLDVFKTIHACIRRTMTCAAHGRSTPWVRTGHHWQRTYRNSAAGRAASEHGPEDVQSATGQGQHGLDGVSPPTRLLS